MILLLFLFISLCVGTVMIQRIGAVQALGLRLNLWLVLFSAGMFALWYGLNSYSPPLSIAEHWRMVLISLAGFLSMLLSVVSVVRNFTGFWSGAISIVSFALGIVHFVDLIVSMPVS